MAYFETKAISGLFENILNTKTTRFQNDLISAYYENEVISTYAFQDI